MMDYIFNNVIVSENIKLALKPEEYLNDCLIRGRVEVVKEYLTVKLLGYNIIIHNQFLYRQSIRTSDEKPT